MKRRRLCWLLLALGCGAPTDIEVAISGPRLLHVFGALDPAYGSQRILIEATEVGGVIGEVQGELFEIVPGLGEVPIATAQVAYDDLCGVETQRSNLNDSRCLYFGVEIRAGATYRIQIAAAGRRSISATTTVPIPFAIREVAAAERPDGSVDITARWSRSIQSYGYLVSIGPVSGARVCVDLGCPFPWVRFVRDTTLTDLIPVTVIGEYQSPIRVAVMALDRALYDYLTTGSGGGLFPIPPVQNVIGGQGVLGAWVRTFAPLAATTLSASRSPRTAVRPGRCRSAAAGQFSGPCP
ncbi:MAG: DUF4249 family protein [Gemmatimonadales bacterium]|nr:DUF4249 family protein [Gemmatimonadales bacterium]